MQPQTVPPLLQLMPIFVIFIIFYILLIRPQKKQEKERQAMLKNIKKNDEVVTSGGIYGVVINLKDKTVTLRIDDNVKVEIERSAISRIEKVA